MQRCIRRRFKCSNEIVHAGRVCYSEAAGEASQPLRSDHTGAAASAEQSGGGGGRRHGVRTCAGVEFVDSLHGGGEGATQIRAGVAVGDGEDVDLIERLAVERDPASGAGDHPPHRVTIQRVLDWLLWFDHRCIHEHGGGVACVSLPARRVLV